MIEIAFEISRAVLVDIIYIWITVFSRDEVKYLNKMKI